MVYRFKVWFEDMEDVVRWIDINPSHTFLDFHNCIQEAIGFDKKELASFYISDAKWRKLLEITSEEILMEAPEGGENETAAPAVWMKNAKLRDYINDPHQRFVYVTDITVEWTLFCEMQTIADEQARKEYPLLYRSEGKAPRQREDNRFKMLDESEFDALAAKILAAKNAKNIMDGAEEELGVDVPGEEDDDETSSDDAEDFGLNDFGTSDEDLNTGFTEVSAPE